MLISEITIKNFKSFGNNEQVLKLNTEHGQLILLAGRNGNGKSSILETVEYLLYGKVKSKTKKWSKLSNLPNRINGELMCKIKFISNNTDILIERGMSPNVLKIHENGVYDERAGKVNIESKIEKYKKGSTVKMMVNYSKKEFSGKIVTIKQLAKYADITTAFPDYEPEEAIYEIKVIPENQQEAKDILVNSNVTLK